MIRIGDAFLADVFVKCDLCKGNRFNRETLEIKFKDKNISDILNMTVDEGLNFFFFKAILNFEQISNIEKGRSWIHKNWTISHNFVRGEVQRIKLAKELSKDRLEKLLYILDEPTTGLHSHDVNKLLEILHGFVEKKILSLLLNITLM